MAFHLSYIFTVLIENLNKEILGTNFFIIEVSVAVNSVIKNVRINVKNYTGWDYSNKKIVSIKKLSEEKNKKVWKKIAF